MAGPSEVAAVPLGMSYTWWNFGSEIGSEKFWWRGSSFDRRYASRRA